MRKMSSLPTKRLSPSKHRPASRATEALRNSNARAQVCWAPARGLGQAHEAPGNAPMCASPPSPKQEAGDTASQGCGNMVWQMERLYGKEGCRVEIGEGVFWVFWGFCFFF